jgi:hypothetical protein
VAREILVERRQDEVRGDFSIDDTEYEARAINDTRSLLADIEHLISEEGLETVFFETSFENQERSLIVIQLATHRRAAADSIHTLIQCLKRKEEHARRLKGVTTELTKNHVQALNE